jgi:REP element-mobilizing transposase RayT
MWLRTLAQACAKTGWRVHGWLLMDNHYHRVIETPQANLVEGMRWLQNPYTRPFNSRHKLWGMFLAGAIRRFCSRATPTQKDIIWLTSWITFTLTRFELPWLIQDAV